MKRKSDKFPTRKNKLLRKGTQSDDTEIFFPAPTLC